jgi:hypothetical protein
MMPQEGSLTREKGCDSLAELPAKQVLGRPAHPNIGGISDGTIRFNQIETNALVS